MILSITLHTDELLLVFQSDPGSCEVNFRISVDVTEFSSLKI